MGDHNPCPVRDRMWAHASCGAAAAVDRYPPARRRKGRGGVVCLDSRQAQSERWRGAAHTAPLNNAAPLGLPPGPTHPPLVIWPKFSPGLQPIKKILCCLWVGTGPPPPVFLYKEPWPRIARQRVGRLLRHHSWQD